MSTVTTTRQRTNNVAKTAATVAHEEFNQAGLPVSRRQIKYDSDVKGVERCYKEQLSICMSIEVRIIDKLGNCDCRLFDLF